jgi:hypothetical protein
MLARPQDHPTGLALEVVSLVVGAHPAIGDGPAAGCLGMTLVGRAC